MDTETAYKQFEFRCYEWGQEDFQREIVRGYPYLKTIADRDVQSWIVLFEGLNYEQKQLLSQLLVKRVFKSKRQILPTFN